MSVLTPTIPGREHFLAENIASVQAQTFKRWEHLIGLDTEAVGCAATMNHLANQAEAGWLFILADDDLMLPRCLEHHLSVSINCQIVYAPPLVWGEPAEQFHSSPPNIPAVALISTEWWHRLGGYKPELARTEDRDFWVRSWDRSAHFVRYDEQPTWMYRFHGGNKSRNP